MDRGTAGDPGQLKLFDEPAPEGAGERRVLLLAGQPVEYRFARRARRTIGIRVGAEGLSVAAPLRAPWREVEGFLREKEGWILDKLAQWAERGQPLRIFGESGESLPLQGREVILAVTQGRRAVRLVETELRIAVPEPHRRGAVRAALVAWLKATALAQLVPRVAHYAARVSLPPPPFALSSARTRWGACTARGRIRLSWRLVHFAPEVADYVVAHEVAHLVELNHSERFWALVEWLYPHWREARDSIERGAATIPNY